VSEGYLWAALGVLALGNLLTRAAPFLFFARHKPPRAVLFIERNFPPVILTILVFYTLGDLHHARLLPLAEKLAAIIVTMGLHRWRGNYLLSIFGGTAFYMALIRF